MWFYRSHLSSKKAQQLHKQVLVWYSPEKKKKINIQDNSGASNLSRPERNEFLLWAYLKFPSFFRYHGTRSLQRLRGPQASVLHHLPQRLNHRTKCVRFLNVPPDLKGKEDFSQRCPTMLAPVIARRFVLQVETVAVHGKSFFFKQGFQK